MKLPPSHEQIIAAVRKALPQARAAWLFGSVVSGRFGPGNDIDLAVDLVSPLSPAARWEMTHRLAQDLGTDVDLLDFRRLSTVMQYQVLATGQRLFSVDEGATAAYCGFVLSEYQNIQAWRQPMMRQLAQRLAPRRWT
ncbi:MAG: nucleotidyltransferase domain-containing protein [Comamonadaceae bacterium]|nr:MAG: nucleotidyltransferase domain-containing protein [Comamonadaceae bacterium]